MKKIFGLIFICSLLGFHVASGASGPAATSDAPDLTAALLQKKPVLLLCA